jgi:hypothetical protein
MEAAVSASRRALPVAGADHTTSVADAGWLARREDLARYASAARPMDFVGRGIWVIAEALFSRESGPPPAERLGWLCAEVKDVLAHAGARSRRTFVLALVFVTLFAPIFSGRLAFLWNVPVGERGKILERFERGGIAQVAAILALKAILCILYYEHPDVADEIGFENRCKGVER